jgi:predicted porin
MKKSLLAIAAMTAFAGAAQAQSSVTVYGILDGAYTATDNATTTDGTQVTEKARNTVNGDGALSTSRIGFKGTEDLGGGTKAQFVLEYDLVNIGNGGNGTNISATGETGTNTNGAASGFGARESWIGLTNSKMGTLRLGRQQQSIHAVITNGLAGSANNIAGSIYSSGTNSAVNTATIRPHLVYLNQAITYISPAISGFTLQAQTSQNAYSASDATPSAGASENGASVTFTGVKNLKVAYGLAQSNIVVANTSNVKRFTQALTANYNFGPAQVFAAATQNKSDNLASGLNAGDTKAYELGLKAPVTPKIGVWASVFTGTRNSGTDSATLAGGTSGVGRADLGGFQLGSTYSLSKRTTAYAIYGQQSIKGKEAATNDKIVSSGYAVGLRHTF